MKKKKKNNMESQFKNAILEVLEAWNYAVIAPTTRNIAKSVKCSPSMAFLCLRELAEEDKISIHGKGRRKLWVLKK